MKIEGTLQVNTIDKNSEFADDYDDGDLSSSQLSFEQHE